MKSINGIDWKINNIPERLILKNMQIYNISYLLSKIFLEKKYTDDEIYSSIYNSKDIAINYINTDFEKAGKLISKNLKSHKKILIFGDYDVDGYSSTYLLYDYFASLGVNCDYYIPDRIIDGYGPNLQLLKKIIHKKNYGLVFFVDCGSNSLDEINYLNNYGVNTIIIDHHQIHEQTKSKKNVIINPLKDHILTKYSFFCATTLVFFFIKYLINILPCKNKSDSKNKYLFFSALATICDQMPLRGYNKQIVKEGLKNFNLNKFYNLKKLINVKKKINSSDIGFGLGPLLNSASRLGFSGLPFNLLIEKKNLNIVEISNKLVNLNEKRKLNQIKTFNLLKSKFDMLNKGIIFKFKTNINEGFLGIIASNFVELYNKPTFVLTNSSKLIKCSARSVKGYDIGKIFYLALKEKIILKGGGHSMAGGCTLKKEKLKDFENFLNKNFLKKFKNFKNINYYISEQNFASLLTFSKKEFQYLEPLGNDNTSPFFLVKNNKILKFKIIKDLHLNLIVKNKYNKSCKCLAFNVIGSKLGEILMNTKNEIDLIIQINNNIIQKNSDFNLIIKDAII